MKQFVFDVQHLDPMRNFLNLLGLAGRYAFWEGEFSGWITSTDPIVQKAIERDFVPLTRVNTYPTTK